MPPAPDATARRPYHRKLGKFRSFKIAKLSAVLIKIAIMNRPVFYSLSILLVGLLLAPGQVSARPVDFNEVSLLVRCRESESSIRDEVSRRKLMRPLTTQQETTLKGQGASDSLVQSLRGANLVASKEEVDAVDARDRRLAAARTESASLPRPEVHVFNVAFGHPINLSEYGGADYEIVINSYRLAGEDHIEPIIVNNYRTGTDVARYVHMTSESEAFNSPWFPINEVRNFRFTPYDRLNDSRDNRFNFTDTVELESHTVGRPIRVDWASPTFIAGQPYTFYRIYGAGGVSLYYIGKASEHSAMVAVVCRPGITGY
jgi:hypothetical protein